MTQVGIVVDSSSCFPLDLAKEYGLIIAPNWVIIDKIGFRDQVDISTAEFWKKFDSAKTSITTSIVSPGDFVNIFRKLAQSTDSIACFTLSPKLSGTMNSAVQAKEMVLAEVPGLKIEIIDSKSSIGALSYTALEAARTARAGGDMKAVVKRAQEIIPRTKYLLVLETAKYIMRIGRGPEEAKKLAEQANFNPIMGVVRDTGMVDMLGKEATLADAQRKAVDLMASYADTSKPWHVMLHYSRDKNEIKELEKQIRAKYNCAELYTSEFSPVVVAALDPPWG